MVDVVIDGVYYSMKIDTAVIFAGGLGSRLGDETKIVPKPLVHIGDKPMLWHIMKIYSKFGINNFIICAGYLQDKIKEYFSNYYLKNSDITVDLENDQVKVHSTNSEKWKITIIDTGTYCQTAARLLKIRPFLKNKPFALTYGDGVSDVNIDEVCKYHESHNAVCTLTAVQPVPRFGILDIGSDGGVTTFKEKQNTDGNWINGGFFICNPEIFDYISSDETISFEKGPLTNLANNNKLFAYRHTGFWQCMDTQREKEFLTTLYTSGDAPWLKQ